VKATLKMVNQAANAKASTLYVFNDEASTSNTVNAEASTFYMVVSDQVANIETSTFYTVDTNTSTFYTVLTDQAANARITSSLVNVQTSTSYTADLEANTLYENAVYDETSFSCKSAVYNEASPSCDNANAEEVKNIVGYIFDSWDDIDFYFKAYDQYSGFVVIKKWVEQHNDGRQLLRAKYPDATFLDADLANAIQHYKIKSKDLETDALQLLSFLIERRLEESGWSVEF
ncbi:16104_t:CDS:2, partial [Racocetra persica]